MSPLICWRFHVFQSTPSLRKATTLRAALTDLPEAFQSTPSLRKATCREQENNSDRAISIHTFLAEGDAGEAVSLRNSHISIHTFLAEGDKDWGAKEEDEEYFNPHLPCGRRLSHFSFQKCYSIFQSTPSLRKATSHITRSPWSWTAFQSTPSLRKATSSCPVIAAYGLFQSTPSLRKATRHYLNTQVILDISIHTFLAEGD